MGESAIFRDERGAIMLLGLFFAIFMAGMLFYVSAVSDSVLLQGRLQDAADVAVFGTAVTHARGMNLLALLNQTMAAALAVLVGLRLTEMLAILGIAVASGLSFVPLVTALIPPLAAVQQGAHEAYVTLNEPVHVTLKALHAAELAVRDTIPGGAVVAYTVSDPTPGAAVIPPRLTLPVESDEYSVLCERAGRDAAEVALAPFEALGLPSPLSDPIKDGAGELAASAAEWFCGKGSAKPPVTERVVERILPRLAARAACEEAAGGTDSQRVKTACSGVDVEESESAPDASGACRSSCGASGPFEERVQRAREQCDPRKRSGLHGFHWSERTVRVHVDPRGLMRRTYESPVELVQQPRTSYLAPCGTSTAIYSAEYEPKVHEEGSAEVQPVCTGKLTPIGVSTKDFEFLEVIHLFQCVVTEKKTIAMKDDGGKAGGSEDESSMRVAKDIDATSDDFQIRGVSAVGTAETWLDRVIAVSAHGRLARGTPLVVDGLSRFSLAEAEYGWDGALPPAEWMWSRSWTAHLSRVRRTDSSAVTAGLAAACVVATKANESCGASALVLETMAGQVVH